MIIPRNGASGEDSLREGRRLLQQRHDEFLSLLGAHVSSHLVQHWRQVATVPTDQFLHDGIEVPTFEEELDTQVASDDLLQDISGTLPSALVSRESSERVEEFEMHSSPFKE